MLPRPINLPSMRAEYGERFDVLLVPKGTRARPRRAPPRRPAACRARCRARLPVPRSRLPSARALRRPTLARPRARRIPCADAGPVWGKSAQPAARADAEPAEPYAAAAVAPTFEAQTAAPRLPSGPPKAPPSASAEPEWRKRLDDAPAAGPPPRAAPQPAPPPAQPAWELDDDGGVALRPVSIGEQLRAADQARRAAALPGAPRHAAAQPGSAASQIRERLFASSVAIEPLAAEGPSGSFWDCTDADWRAGVGPAASYEPAVERPPALAADGAKVRILNRESAAAAAAAAVADGVAPDGSLLMTEGFLYAQPSPFSQLRIADAPPLHLPHAVPRDRAAPPAAAHGRARGSGALAALESAAGAPPAPAREGSSHSQKTSDYAEARARIFGREPERHGREHADAPRRREATPPHAQRQQPRRGGQGGGDQAEHGAHADGAQRAAKKGGRAGAGVPPKPAAAGPPADALWRHASSGGSNSDHTDRNTTGSGNGAAAVQPTQRPGPAPEANGHASARERRPAARDEPSQPQAAQAPQQRARTQQPARGLGGGESGGPPRDDERAHQRTGRQRKPAQPPPPPPLVPPPPPPPPPPSRGGKRQVAPAPAPPSAHPPARTANGELPTSAKATNRTPRQPPQPPQPQPLSEPDGGGEAGGRRKGPNPQRSANAAAAAGPAPPQQPRPPQPQPPPPHDSRADAADAAPGGSQARGVRGARAAKARPTDPAQPADGAAPSAAPRKPPAARRGKAAAAESHSTRRRMPGEASGDDDEDGRDADDY
jgi:hypothetical protein